MKIRQQVLQEPNATPVPGASVRLRNGLDNSTLDVETTDADGFVTFVWDGQPGRYSLHMSGALGGDKFWSAQDATGAGPLVLYDIPFGIKALGDGVIAGLADELEVIATGPTTISVTSGGVLVNGYPVICYMAHIFTLARPVAATRIDRVVMYHRTPDEPFAPGFSGIHIGVGVEGGDAAALVNTATYREVSLALVTVPVVAPITVTDARAYAGLSHDQSDVVRDASVTTSSSTGEYLSPLTLSLPLPQPGTYDIAASLTAYQDSTDTPATWSLTNTWGSLGSGTSPNFNTPEQIVGGFGGINIADFGNNRIVILTEAGAHYAQATGFAGPIGIALDASAGMYIAELGGGLRKYTSYVELLAGTPAWSVMTLGYAPALRHIATDGTYVYVITTPTSFLGTADVQRYLCSTGDYHGTLISSLTSPWGIATDGTYLYVAEGGSADRIAKYTVAGTLVTRWGNSGVGNGQFNEPRGITIGPSGAIWVADFDNDRLQRFTAAGVWVETLAQVRPSGIANNGTVIYAANNYTSNIAEWSPIPAVSAGYGQIAIEIDGVVSDYIGIGDTAGWVEQSAVGTKTGSSTLTVRAFGKATSESLVLEQATLTARAIPRRV